MTAEPEVRVGQGRRPTVRRPWPRLPWWFRLGVALALAGFTWLVVLAVGRIVGFEEQPLYERRPPPRAGAQSHDVGARVVTSREEPAPVSCGAITGIRVAGDEEARARLTEAFGGLCRRLGAMDPRLAERIKAAADRGTVLTFGNFEATGVDSTTLAGSPPRVVVNNRYFAQFKGYLLQVLVHELWHGGSVEVTAEEEFRAREVELAMCRHQLEIATVRGCDESKRIVADGEATAVRRLREAGYR